MSETKDPKDPKDPARDLQRDDALSEIYRDHSAARPAGPSPALREKILRQARSAAADRKAVRPRRNWTRIWQLGLGAAFAFLVANHLAIRSPQAPQEPQDSGVDTAVRGGGKGAAPSGGLDLTAANLATGKDLARAECAVAPAGLPERDARAWQAQIERLGRAQCEDTAHALFVHYIVKLAVAKLAKPPEWSRCSYEFASFDALSPAGRRARIIDLQNAGCDAAVASLAQRYLAPIPAAH